MKTVALIPARAGSRGIVGKNVRPLKGKPVIAYSIEAALNTPGIDKVFVTTEDEGYAKVAEEFGADVLSRPLELGGSNVQTDEVYLYALRQLQFRGIEPETLVLLQPTSPFRTWKDIQRALELYHEMDGEFTILGGFRAKGYYWMADDEDGFMPIAHNPMQRLPRQGYKDSDWLIRENGAIYCSNAKRFAELKTYRIPPFHFYIMDEETSLDLDDERDWGNAVRYAENDR